MHQHEWIRLLKTDPVQAVKWLLYMDFISSPLNGFESFINKPQIKEPK